MQRAFRYIAVAGGRTAVFRRPVSSHAPVLLGSVLLSPLTPVPATGGRRKPLWSGAITVPLARVIPSDRWDEALVAIRTVHTALFASIATATLVALWDGLRGRARRRTAIAGAMVIAEAAVYVSNNQVCPLTPLAEQLGAARGSVVDIFLPSWAARRIPLVAGGAAALALILNVRALSRGMRRGGDNGGADIERFR